MVHQALNPARAARLPVQGPAPCKALFLAVCLAVFLAATPTEAADKTYELRVSHITTETDPIHLGFAFLKETLEAKTGGRIKVTIFGNKALSNSNNEDVEKVQANIVQMCSAPTSSLAAIGNIPEYKVFDYAYLFENNDELYKVIDSDIGEDLSQKLIQKTGIKALGGYNLGWCVVSTNKRPITAPDDLKGLKIRTLSSDLQMEAIRGFGGNPVIVNYGELFTACQQGTVDGMMTSTGLYVSDRFYEVQKYMANTNAMAILHIPMVNARWYDSLPDDLKQAFDETIPLYLEAVRRFEDEYEAAAIARLQEYGMQITILTPEQKQAFIEATAYITTDMADVAGKAIIDRVKAMLGK